MLTTEQQKAIQAILNIAEEYIQELKKEGKGVSAGLITSYLQEAVKALNQTDQKNDNDAK